MKLPVKVGSAVLGAGTGYLTGLHGYGELGGMYLGPRAAEALIPKLPYDMPAKGIGATLPAAEDFYAARAKDLTTRGVAQAALDRRAAIAARALKPDPFAGATPTNVPIGNAALPEVPQGNPTPFSTTAPHEIPGVNAPTGRASAAIAPDFPKPLRPLVGTPEQIAAYEQQMNILGAEASDAGMYHAARGAAGKKTSLQQRMGRKILE